MIVIYDLETLKDFFLYVDLDVSEDKFNVFEISKFKNDFKPLLEHLRSLWGQIGFNNLAFDSQVQEYMIRYEKLLSDLSGEQLAGCLADVATTTIEKSNKNEWPTYWERDLSIRQVDLYRVWHFNNKAKMTGLKWLQYMMDWDNIEDMPISHHDSVDTREKADMIINYCKNDCLSTKRFYEITRGKTELPLYKGIDRLQLRKDVKAEFGFDCTSFDDVKIGDEINKVNYLKTTGISRRELKEKKSIVDSFTFQDCFPNNLKFITQELNDFVNSIRNIQVSIDNKQEFPFKIGGTSYVMARGGLHSNDSPRLIIPTKDQILRDADIGSMYPNTIRKREIYPRHLGIQWLHGYKDVIQKRLDAKKKFKETKEPKYKSIEGAFKLALNGGSFGKLQDKSNWQFDPLACFKVTIGGQLELLMLIERLNLGGINVISANTDGIVSLFDKTQEDLYKKICKEWEQYTGFDGPTTGELEYADYKLFAQRSVNDYIAVKTDDTPKHKGASFTVEHELHKNKSYRVIALALEAFYVKGVNPRHFITSHTNIFDFCAGMKTKGEWWLDAISIEGADEKREKLQKTNRYYVSNKGVKLTKCHRDGRQIQENAGKWMETVYNKHVAKSIKDYDINYNYYIEKAYEVICEIQPDVISEFYTQLSLF